MRATGIALDSLFGSSRGRARARPAARPRREPGRLRGPGAPHRRSRRVRPHPAGRRARSPPATTEAFNILLPLLGAIVTDNGGLLSHSAIVAREYGIPGVVGTREATERIADGTLVRVDGTAGEVTVLG